MPQTISAFARLARIGLEEVLDLHAKELRPQWTRLVRQISTRQDFVEFHGISDFGLAQVTGELQQVNYDTLRQGYYSRWHPLMRTIGYQVSKQARMTDQYNKIKEPGPKLAMAMLQTKEWHVANLLNFGFLPSYPGPDGVSLYNSAHPLDSGTASNRLSTDMALSIDALELLLTEMRMARSHRGNIMPIVDRVELTVPVALWMRSIRLTEATRLPQSNDNDPNPAGQRVTAVVNDYLTSTTAYYAQTDQHSKFLCQRIPRFVEVDYDLDVQAWKTVCGEEYVAGWKDWRGDFASLGS